MNESFLNKLLLDIDLDITSVELERIELKLSTFKFNEAYQMIQKCINKKEKS